MTGEELAFGDLDGDGLDEALVAAFGPAGGTGVGAVYAVPAPRGEVALEDAPLVIRGDVASMRLGTAVTAEDADGDGQDDLLLGASGDGVGGAAFLYLGPRAGTLGRADANATFVGVARGQAAGEGGAIVDVDGDGVTEVLIGANGDASRGYGAGAVYVFVLE